MQRARRKSRPFLFAISRPVSHGDRLVAWLAICYAGSMSPYLDRISIDPRVCFGKPCIKGTRIWVSLILDFLANGDTESEILENYPYLSADDIRAAIAYGAEVARERIVPVPAAAE